jgi:hypothetical protein
LQLDLVVQAVTLASIGVSTSSSVRAAVEALMARGDMKHAFDAMVIGCHVIGPSYYITVLTRAFGLKNATAFACQVARGILKKEPYTKKYAYDNSFREAISFLRSVKQPSLAYRASRKFFFLPEFVYEDSNIDIGASAVEFSMKALSEGAKLELQDMSDFIHCGSCR